MVMEAPPSPDSVGREFVRQYYTLLNKAPTHLHRFYNNQSSFVHGGLDPPHRETLPMIGQKQIHQKIQQLNFQDCHAKIAQVDAQATLGNGVVVQVTGELSNAGQPMRRFTQTFVLAAQSPKKYYVHNDIFRYQDEIISDEECDNETRSETEEEPTPERELPQHQPTYYNPNIPHHVIPTQQPMPTVNGAVHPDEIISQPPMINPVTVQPVQPVQQPREEEIQPVEEPPVVVAEIETYNEPQPEEQIDILAEPASNEPKTYATLLKSGGGAGGYTSVAQQMNNSPPQQKSVSPPPQNRFDSRDMPPGMNPHRNSSNNRGGDAIRQNNRPMQPRPPRQDNRTTPLRNSVNEDGGYEERRRSQQGNFSDSNQLFLGNLPHSATEDDLREIFQTFGTIVDLRIHSKPNPKSVMPGGRAPPNYGFITYDGQIGVQNCLAAKPIYYPGPDKQNALILNVEEKKTKDRNSFGGGGGGGVRMGDNMGPRPRDGGNGNGRPRMGSATGPQQRGPMGGSGGGGGPPGGNPNRPNNYNRNGPPNRGPNTTYNNRR